MLCLADAIGVVCRVLWLADAIGVVCRVLWHADVGCGYIW